MQLILCSLIIIAATLFVANRWCPATLKRRILASLGISPKLSPAGGCSNCSSCGNCGNSKTPEKSATIYFGKDKRD